MVHILALAIQLKLSVALWTAANMLTVATTEVDAGGLVVSAGDILLVTLK
jgi:hypothetical protein